MKKKVLITGATGQCGSHLVDLLLEKDYDVFGLVRRSATSNTDNIKHNLNNGNFTLVEGDLEDARVLAHNIKLIKPDELYNTAAQSHVGYSFQNPEVTFNANLKGVLNLLEAVRLHSPTTKFVQFSTSEMFGGMESVAYTENSPLHPRSPYGVSKCSAHWLTIHYREAYNLFACCGIFFNQEGERRGMNFVTRKATIAAAEIALGLRSKIGFGNIDTYRDWGYAPDYMEGCWRILQQEKPDEFIFASGQTHCIREMLDVVFVHAGLGDYQKYVYEDPKFYRPTEVNVLIGDSTKARKNLGWEPKVSFTEMAKRMYDHDYKLLGGVDE
ncbi:MAG: GDP-mannose 4,6-dehydratase [Bacteroidetes bacterium]|nr:GDP-mannose 4,6-dehydratase [Bacteroidota bacterium]